jgi:hypothetical protein
VATLFFFAGVFFEVVFFEVVFPETGVLAALVGAADFLTVEALDTLLDVDFTAAVALVFLEGVFLEVDFDTIVSFRQLEFPR